MKHYRAGDEVQTKADRTFPRFEPVDVAIDSSGNLYLGDVAISLYPG
jgi:hypothetical protein